MTRYNQNILTTEHLADLVVGGSQGSGGVQKPDNYEFLRYVEWTQNDLMWCVPNSAPHTQAILVEGDYIGGVGGHMVENPWVWIIQMFSQMSLTKDLYDGVIPEDIDPNGTEFNERYNGYADGVIEKMGLPKEYLSIIQAMRHSTDGRTDYSFRITPRVMGWDLKDTLAVGTNRYYFINELAYYCATFSNMDEMIRRWRGRDSEWDIKNPDMWGTEAQSMEGYYVSALIEVPKEDGLCWAFDTICEIYEGVMAAMSVNTYSLRGGKSIKDIFHKFSDIFPRMLKR